MKNAIPLQRGLFTIVSPEDWDRMTALRWTISGRQYVHHFYKKSGRWTSLLMHRFILNAKPGQCVDHINRDTLDNRRENLRICTQSQNVGNSRNRKKGQCKGVTWDKERCNWIAQIGNHRKSKFLGRFNSMKEAGLAYDEAARKRFGEFALTNQMLGLV